jgi:hypothetical protein
MQSEGVVIVIISTIITAVVATTIVVAAIVAVVAVAVGAFRSPLLGLLIPNVEALSSLPAAAHELRLRSSE